MKKKGPIQVLKGFSWVYMISVILVVIIALFIPTIPEIPEEFKKVVATDVDPLLAIEITLIVRALIDLWYFYLIRRYTSGKSNGTLIMILLIIGVIGNLISIIMFNEKATLSFIIDAVVLFFFYLSKKSK